MPATPTVTALPATVALDTTVISSLHLAGALSRVLELWPGQWLVPLQVRDEVAAWPAHGARAVAELEQLGARGTIIFASPNPGAEGALFARLQRTRGRGESAAIAIAYHRGGIVATDDRPARGSCQALYPPVPTLATEALLTIARDDGLLSPSEAAEIWRATRIRDPTRGLG